MALAGRSPTLAARNARQAWPEGKVGTGPAMSKREFAARIGRSLSSIEMAIRRTTEGTSKVPFPIENGYAVHPDSKRRAMVPYWFERHVIRYGQDIGALDGKGKIIKRK